jgi:hypothetical protein
VKIERRIDEALQDVWESQLPVELILARHRLRIVDMDEPQPKPVISGLAVLSAIREALKDNEDSPELVRADWRAAPYLAYRADHITSLLDEIEEGML